MNGAKTSSISAPLSARRAVRLASTQELTTIGRTPWASPAARMRPATSSAFSTVSTKDSRSVTNRGPVNWVRRLWPMVSAVIPVPSET